LTRIADLMSARPRTPSTRIPSLDGWRALAILLVLGNHMAFTSHVPLAVANGAFTFFHGDLGVRIFFVLSGFIISLLLLEEGHAHGTVSLAKFYTRRVFRIFPVYFAYLLVLGALALAGLYHDTASSWIGCLTFTRNLVGHGDSGTTHFWSLAIEEQFYLVWPLLVARLRLWQRDALYLGLLAIPLLLGPLFRGLWATDDLGPTVWHRLLSLNSPFMYADSLATGCIGAWIFRKSAPPWQWTGWHTATLAASFVLLVAGELPPLAKGALVPTLQACAALGCILLSTHPHAVGFRLLNSRPIVTIGLLSYSLYVWHFLFLSYFMGPAFTEWPTHDWKFWLLPATAAAVLSYYCLEKPLLELRKKLHG
jgi:peptidoglycan/LPS O-acetylase OafA/YrhL